MTADQDGPADQTAREVDHFGKPMAEAYQFGTDLIRSAFTARFSEKQIAAVVDDWLNGQDEPDEMLPFLVYMMPSAVRLTAMWAATPMVLLPEADSLLPAERRADRRAVMRALELMQADCAEEGITHLRNRLFDAVDERASAICMVAAAVLVGVEVCATAQRKMMRASRESRPVSSGGRHRLNDTADEYFTPIDSGGASARDET